MINPLTVEDEMKTAIYIEDGVLQLVITPESKFEKDVISMMIGEKINASVFSGSFYDCQGGWVRQKNFYQESSAFNTIGSANDKSLILKIDKEIEIVPHE